jgi:hypothetical protein
MLQSPPLDRAWLFLVAAVVGVVLAMLAASASRAAAAQATSRQLWTGTIDGQKIEMTQAEEGRRYWAAGQRPTGAGNRLVFTTRA